MLKCNVCNDDKVYSVRFVENGVFACTKCLREPLPIDNKNLHGKVKLVDKYVPRAWLNEYERRVAFKSKDKDGDYEIGRRGENGKIQEREVDLHI